LYPGTCKHHYLILNQGQAGQVWASDSIKRILFNANIARDREQSECWESRISNGDHAPDMNVGAVLPTEI